jgi:hypothetical protein
MVRSELDEIKDYKMIEGDYKIMINILEGSELCSKNDDYVIFKAEKTACDAYVEVESRGVRKKTQVRKETNNPIFDSKFNLLFKGLKYSELISSDLTIRVIDRKSILLSDAVLGQCTLDWTSVYFSRNHELYRTWVALSDPLNENEGVTGYVLANISILGPHDKQTIHDSSYIKNPLTTVEAVVADKRVAFAEFLLEIEIYRAEGLTPTSMLDYDIRAYVVAKFSGNKVATRVRKSKNPEWNENLQIATQIPNKSKYVFLELWNYNKVEKDDLIGVVVVDFADMYNRGSIGPKFGHIYGPPRKGRDADRPYATEMVLYGHEKGSHFRGRLLYKASCCPANSPKTKSVPLRFEFPYNPAPVVPTKMYSLLIDFIEGFEVPLISKMYSAHAMIGTYLIRSKRKEVREGNVRWFDSVEAKQVQFPTDASQIPDLIVYLSQSDVEEDRVGFCRINPAEILITSKSASKALIEKSITLREDKSLNLVSDGEATGFIRLRMGLYDVAPPPRVALNEASFVTGKYELRVFVLIGRNLSAKNADGTSNPFLLLKCAGKRVQSNVWRDSLNPNWFQECRMEVELEHKSTAFEKGMMVYMYDHEDSGNHNFMGRTWVPISWQKKHLRVFRAGHRETKVLFKPAKWYTIIDDEEDNRGKVMLSYLLIPLEDSQLLPSVRSLKPKGSLRRIQIFVLGLRQIEEEYF